MHPFDLEQLILPAAAIFLVTLVFSFRITRLPAISIASALIKTGIFFIYFGFLFDGTFTFLDDWVYLEGGRQLVEDDVRLTNLHKNWHGVLALAGGDHIVYYLYNAYALRLFGDGYFAPVAMNILLTVVIALLGAHLMRREFPDLNCKAFYLFLLFHPDILSWSTVMNGKDTLVLLLHMVLLFGVSMLFRGDKIKAVAAGIPAAAILLFIRFYVPLLFAVSFFVSTLRITRKSFGYIFLSTLFTGAAIFYLSDGFYYALDSLKENFVNPVWGLVRFLLTPIPFNTEPAYAFLDPASLIHWLLLPAFVFGMLMVWRRKTHFSRFMILYFFTFVGLYAVYGELQGPRHRVQIDFAIALFQFIGVSILLRKIFRRFLKYS